MIIVVHIILDNKRDILWPGLSQLEGQPSFVDKDHRGAVQGLLYSPLDNAILSIRENIAVGC